MCDKAEYKVKIAGVVDGDPFDSSTWSGASHHFFRALQEMGFLADAVSGLPNKFSIFFYKLINFHPNLDKWQFKYHLDTRFYSKMREKAAYELNKMNAKFNHVLQINVWFNVPSIISDKNISTSIYTGSNLATQLSSPYGYPKISKDIIDRAFLYETKVYQNLNFIFTRSEWARTSFIRDFQLHPQKVINVGTGSNFYELPEKYEKKYNSKNILFIGTDFLRKGGQYLLDAFKIVKRDIPEATLTIIGPNLSNVPHGVNCLGYISQNSFEGQRTIHNTYRNAAIFVMPSLYEPFGNVFLEAMSFMVPCLGTDVCAIPEIIADGQTGFVVPARDADTLADRMIEMLRKSDMLEEMGNQAYERVKKRYDWKRVVTKIVYTLVESTRTVN